MISSIDPAVADELNIGHPLQTQSFLKPWLCGTTGIPIQITPLGRSWNQYDGTMGTTANAMFLSSVYGQAIYTSATPGYPAKAKRYVCWARVQVRTHVQSRSQLTAVVVPSAPRSSGGRCLLPTHLFPEFEKSSVGGVAAHNPSYLGLLGRVPSQNKVMKLCSSHDSFSWGAVHILKWNRPLAVS